MKKLLSLLLVATPVAVLAATEPKLADLLDLPATDQVTWGQRYEHGESVGRDVATAIHLYCAAAWAGNADAAYQLGWLYMNGRGVARDDDLAGAWLRRASAADHEHAYRTLKHLGDYDGSREAVCIAPVENAEIVVQAQLDGSKPLVDTVVRQSLAGSESASRNDHATVVEVDATVKSWATAWSQRDADAYLGFYSTRFQPHAGTSRNQWETQRRALVTTPLFIELAIGEFHVTALEPGRVRVRFSQHYRSDRFADRVVKELVLTLEADGWKIQREHVLELLAMRQLGKL